MDQKYITVSSESSWRDGKKPIPPNGVEIQIGDADTDVDTAPLCEFMVASVESGWKLVSLNLTKDEAHSIIDALNVWTRGDR